MIGQLKGQVTYSNEKLIILDVSGVGYKLSLTSSDLATLSDKHDSKTVTLWTYLSVKDDALDLYGFLNKNELDFFELLISISGIGPKKALGILSVAPVDTIKKAVRSKDTSYLTRVSGIGQKNAEKIVLELKDKFEALTDGEVGPSLKEETDAVEAIKSLGYSTGQAREALKKTDPSVKGLNDRIREALKNLGRK